VFMDQGAVVEAERPQNVLAAPKEARTRAFLSRLLESRG
jgi:ABC-type polar amino acid transport system ATPase subunit